MGSHYLCLLQEKAMADPQVDMMPLLPVVIKMIEALPSLG